MSTVDKFDQVPQNSPRSPLRRHPDVSGAAVPRTARGIETRERIVETALIEFAKHGYVAARVESITESAGLAYGTFYRYFSNKADLIAHVAEDVYSDIFTKATSETGSERPIHERVFNDYLASLRAYTFHRDALRVLDAAVGADHTVASKVERLQERDVERYASIISTTPGYRPVGDTYRPVVARQRDGRRVSTPLDLLGALLRRPGG